MTIKEVIKKDGSKIYRQSIYLGVDSVTGKKVKTTITGRTKKAVKQKVQDAKYQFKAKGSTVYQSVTIKTYKELAHLWLENYQYTVKPQTYIVTKNMLDKQILPAFGDLRLDKITISVIQQFINRLSKTYIHYKTVHSINRRIFQYAVTLQVLKYNPAREVTLPKKQKQGKEKVKFIDKTTLKALMAYMEDLSHQKYHYYLDYVLYSLLLATGCRFGEVVALEWSDIDLEQQTITISKTYNRMVDAVGTPKTKSGNRTISIDKKTVNLLRLYQVRQRQLFLEVGGEVPLVVFATPSRIYQHSGIRQASLNHRLNEIDCPRFTFHAFRHTHASLLLNAGISYKELQYRLGHATLAMTMDIYGHLSKDKEKEAVHYFEKAIQNL